MANAPVDYLIIDPKERTVRKFATKDYKAACREAGLGDLGVDFGTISRPLDGGSVSIICYEWGLIDNKFTDCFFVGQRLYVGPAVIFQADEEGETVDFRASAEYVATHHVTWLGDKADAERAIQQGRVIRPQTTVNGEVVWEWRHGQVNGASP